jgi:hypothetical protein
MKATLLDQERVDVDPDGNGYFSAATTCAAFSIDNLDASQPNLRHT